MDAKFTTDILSEVADYFANREDANHNGERYVPNTEMRLLQDVQQAEQLIGEMYEALKAAEDALASDHVVGDSVFSTNCDGCDAILQIRAALAKVEGK